MKSIEEKEGVIVYYKNPAGYIKDDTATVDSIFKSNELEKWLMRKKVSAIWKEGVYEKMVQNNIQNIEEINNPKHCRIWQLKPESDFALRFISYDAMIKNSGEINKDNYEIVYDGETETNDLEKIYEKFNIDHPQSFKGHSLSVSDVIELYDEKATEVYYVDSIGFKNIEFADLNNMQKMGDNKCQTM